MRVWQCPGPTRFLSDLSESLLDGRSVVLRTPPLAADGLEQELRSTLSQTGWALTRVDDNGAGASRQVLEAAWIEEGLSTDITPSMIRTSAMLSGRIFWCVPQDVVGVRRWLSFLDDYAIACRSFPDADGPRFVLALSGPLACPVPSKRTGIEIADVGDAIGQTDVLLLAYYLSGMSEGATLRAQLLAHTASALSIWDVALLLRLLDEPERLFDPIPILREYAAEQGWTGNTPRQWDNGTVRMISGKEHTHSALLSLDDKQGVIASRLWAGQAAVLLPAIERRRLELIEENRSLLLRELPVITPFETVQDIYDLQIGPVWFLLKKRLAGAPAVARALRLKLARDNLAHLKPLTAADALSKEISGD